jgi:hypothetical protein
LSGVSAKKRGAVKKKPFEPESSKGFDGNAD